MRVAVTTLMLLLLPGAFAYGADSAGRGAYLVTLLGCGRCHTEGYLSSNTPTGPHLAGSRIGIAYTAGDPPGIVFPSNLTPDPATGIGGWSQQDIIRAMTTGVGRHGHERLTVMPWVNYTALHRDDLEAIADYLLSQPPIERQIPGSVPAGTSAAVEYVRFGTYHFVPHAAESTPR